MAGKEYTGSDKIVQKMSRDGLTEENLHDGSVRNLREKVREDPLEQEESTSKRNKKYQKLRTQEAIPEKDLGITKEKVQKNRQRKRLIEEQKKVSKLYFDDEGKIAPGSRFGRKAISATGAALYQQAVSKEEMDDNAAVDGVQAGKQLAEQSAHGLRELQQRMHRTSGKRSQSYYQEVETTTKERLQFTESEGGTHEAKKEAKKQKELQKKNYKKSYAAKKRGKKGKGATKEAVRETFTEKAKRAMDEIIRKNKGVFLVIGIIALLFFMISGMLSSCAASMQGAGSALQLTTYSSSDEDIYQAENAYKALETALNHQVNHMELTHPGYDEYLYDIAEINHNPYHLISYLTVKYGDFTYEQVADTIQELFRAQYGLTVEGKTETKTETKTVRVGESLGNVVTSGYCSCSICCGQWAGGPTASGVMPTANHTIAVDARNPIVPLGTKIVMNGVEYTVEDTGAFARYGVAFDVYYDNHSAASAHGHQTWEAFIADSNGSESVTVTNTTTKKILMASLSNQGFDAVARANLSDEELVLYNALNTTYGNRNYLFDLHTLPSIGSGMSYDIPPEALSDQRFANMIREAEKYLGYPYVWGGASPSTSFDCSGFVSWVINNCGNGWNYGRNTAEGLRGLCTYVSPAEAKPGDLIFFEKTYNTAGASHVGIYVGNGMMIHCGNPIQYANTNSSYWQQHFLCFGRLP